jgi:hypothetical protein
MTSIDDRLVKQKEAARLLGISVSTLRAKPDMPYVLMPGSRTGGRKIRSYRLSALYQYIEQHTIDPMPRAG